MSKSPVTGSIRDLPLLLRNVERTPSEANTFNESNRSPWTNQNGDANDVETSNEPATQPNNEPKLQLNMDSLRPIPAPQNFDASPNWKPALLNARDQTASDPKVRSIDRQPANASSIHEVRFLNSVRNVEPSPISNTTNESVIQATLRPISRPAASVGAKPLPNENRPLDTSGWSTV